MRKTVIGFTLSTLLLTLSSSAQAQQPTKVPRIGYLNAVSPFSVSDRIEAFRQGLLEPGYVEGKNIIIEWRYAEGKLDRLPALAAELVRVKVEVIVTSGAIPTRHTQEATSTIPIVMAQDNDPVGNGFVASLARPGGNITGLSTLAPELSGKRFEILKEIVPKLYRLAVFGSSNYPGNQQALQEVKLAAGAFKMQVQYVEVSSFKDIEPGFLAAVEKRADAVLFMVPSGVVNSIRKEIAELAVKSRLPATYTSSAGTWKLAGS